MEFVPYKSFQIFLPNVDLKIKIHRTSTKHFLICFLKEFTSYLFEYSRYVFTVWKLVKYSSFFKECLSLKATGYEKIPFEWENFSTFSLKKNENRENFINRWFSKAFESSIDDCNFMKLFYEWTYFMHILTHSKYVMTDTIHSLNSDRKSIQNNKVSKVNH